MGDKRVCISKQTTFIALILLLLLGYMLFAYSTLHNKTNTNSRAADIGLKKTETKKQKLPELTDKKLETLRFRSGVVNNQGEFQLIGEDIAAKKIEVYFINDKGETEFVGSSEKKDKTKKYLQSQSKIKLNQKILQSQQLMVVDAE